MNIEDALNKATIAVEQSFFDCGTSEQTFEDTLNSYVENGLLPMLNDLGILVDDELRTKIDNSKVVQSLSTSEFIMVAKRTQLFYRRNLQSPSDLEVNDESFAICTGCATPKAIIDYHYVNVQDINIEYPELRPVLNSTLLSGADDYHGYIFLIHEMIHCLANYQVISYVRKMTNDLSIDDGPTEVFCRISAQYWMDNCPLAKVVVGKPTLYTQKVHDFCDFLDQFGNTKMNVLKGIARLYF